MVMDIEENNDSMQHDIKNISNLITGSISLITEHSKLNMSRKSSVVSYMDKFKLVNYSYKIKIWVFDFKYSHIDPN
jgi:hypothetical protein